MEGACKPRKCLSRFTTERLSYPSQRGDLLDIVAAVDGIVYLLPAIGQLCQGGENSRGKWSQFYAESRDGDAGALRKEMTCISALPKSRFHRETAALAAAAPTRSWSRPVRHVSSCFSIFCSGPQHTFLNTFTTNDCLLAFISLSHWMIFSDFFASFWTCYSVASSPQPPRPLLLLPLVTVSLHPSLCPFSSSLSLLHPEEVGHALLKLPCSVTSSSTHHNLHNPQYSAL